MSLYVPQNSIGGQTGDKNKYNINLLKEKGQIFVEVKGLFY